MYFNVVSDYWDQYASRELNRTIHPADAMFMASATEGDYWAVGEAGLSVISSTLSLCRLRQVRRVLDFGCGHGRVARHLRAFFPGAEMFFCDIDDTGSGFCADTFGGEVVAASLDPTRISLPPGLDVIWLGSVFTHLPYAKMEALFEQLFASLAPGGALIVTYRGRKMHEIMSAQEVRQIQKWTPLLTEYRRTGIAYQPYSNEDPDWGLSLNSIESMIAMGKRYGDARLLCLSEAGWAVAHDVIAWTRSLSRPEGQSQIRLSPTDVDRGLEMELA